MTAPKKPQYYNYSPEIPSLDETQDVLPLPEERERQEEPSGRRRRDGRRRQVASNQDVQSPKAAPKQADNNKSKESAKERKNGFRDWLNSTVTRSVIGIVLGGLGFWLGVAFISYFTSCIADQSAVLSNGVGTLHSVSNNAGEGGARLTEILINQGFGVGSFVIVVWLLCVSLKLLVGFPKFRILDFTIKSLFAFITLSIVVGMLSLGYDSEVNWGGMHGRFINEKIYEMIGPSGALILSVVLIALFVVICLRDTVKWILTKKRIYDERRREQRAALEAQRIEDEERKAVHNNDLEEQSIPQESSDKAPSEFSPSEYALESVEFDPASDLLYDIPDLEDEDDIESESHPMDNLLIDEEESDPFAAPSDVADNTDVISDPVIDELPLSQNTESISPRQDNVTSDAPSVLNDPSAFHDSEFDSSQLSDDSEASEEKSFDESVDNPVDNADDSKDENPGEEYNADVDDVMTVNVNHIEKADSNPQPAYDSSLFTHEYVFPSTDYLLPGKDHIPVDAEEQKENKERIQRTLLDFGIPITSIEATVGPTVTLYEIRPDSGVKIARIKNLADDLALSLAAKGVRIIAPIPGKGTVGIEVANKDPQTVSMRTIIQSRAYQESKFKLPIALGTTISNDVYIADLAKMPHLLVAGATGQGKSVGLNAIVTSLLYSKRPEELKFVMVDPKRVEFSLYAKIENYYLAQIPDSPQPIITNMENVVATLSSLCVEMDERYALLEKAFVRQVSEYNEKFKAKKLNPAEGHRYMPYIVVIIDEFADLIMTAGKEVETPIARLAQLARAIGIHVIIATQRPSTNVITGMIKANFPVRIAFKVSSGVDSKTILDSTGAQQLIGRGDMLISNGGELTRVQCAFVDTPEVEEICDYISRQPYPQGSYKLPEPQIGGETDASDVNQTPIGKLDPLLAEVAQEVVMTGVASTSAVQRRYEIGFNRAGRIMDQLQKLGVVGPATGGKPRAVLVDASTLQDILSSLNS